MFVFLFPRGSCLPNPDAGGRQARGIDWGCLVGAMTTDLCKVKGADCSAPSPSPPPPENFGDRQSWIYEGNQYFYREFGDGSQALFERKHPAEVASHERLGWVASGQLLTFSSSASFCSLPSYSSLQSADAPVTTGRGLDTTEFLRDRVLCGREGQKKAFIVQRPTSFLAALPAFRITSVVFRSVGPVVHSRSATRPCPLIL